MKSECLVEATHLHGSGRCREFKSWDRSEAGGTEMAVRSVLVALAGAGVLAYSFQLMDLYGALRAGDTFLLSDTDFVNYWMGGKWIVRATSGSFHAVDLHPTRGAKLWCGAPVPKLELPPACSVSFHASGADALQRGIRCVFGGRACALRRVRIEIPCRVCRRCESRCTPVCHSCFCRCDVRGCANGFSTGALLLAGLAWMRRRPLFAGISLGC